MVPATAPKSSWSKTLNTRAPTPLLSSPSTPFSRSPLTMLSIVYTVLSQLILDGDTTKPMPLLGYGTCCRPTAKGPPLIKSTKEYLAQGGRLIDTAQMYGNHEDLAVAIKESGVPRDQLWITSKINTKAVSTRKAADESIRATVKELGVDYVDLMLIHGLWTISADEAVEVWKGLLDAKKDGRVRHIGVSNMERPQLEKLIAATGVKPSALQLEYHPYVDPPVHELVAWAKQQGMAITAYGSLGGARNKARVSGEVAKVAQAAAHGISSATLLLRWALERGCAVIPGATTAEHIRDNLNVLSVKVTGDELQRAFGGSAARPKTFAAWTNLPSELERRKKKGKRGRRLG